MHFRAILLILPLASVSLYACEEQFGAEIPPGYEDVEYAGATNDEMLDSFVDAAEKRPAIEVPTQKAILDVPTAGAVLPKVPVALFDWHVGAMADRQAPSKTAPARFVIEDVMGRPTAPRWPALSPSPRSSAAALASPLRELFGPPRSARADGAPYSGVATFIVFSTPTNPTLVRVITSETSYSPSQAAWDKLTSTAEPIALTLQTAVFTINSVTEDGGPFLGTSTQFSIAQ